MSDLRSVVPRAPIRVKRHAYGSRAARTSQTQHNGQAVEGNLGGFACNSALVFGGVLHLVEQRHGRVPDRRIRNGSRVCGRFRGGTCWPLACFVQTDNHRGIVRSGPRPTPSSIVFKLGGVARSTPGAGRVLRPEGSYLTASRDLSWPSVDSLIRFAYCGRLRSASRAAQPLSSEVRA
jgi:hypothetical protein